MIKKILYIAAWSILCLAAGVVIGCLSCQPEPQTVTVEVPAQEILSVLNDIKTTQKIIKGIEFPKSYTIYVPGETIYIDSSTPYGNVPVTETQFDTSFTIKINDSMKRFDVSVTITHKGEVFDHTFILHPASVKVDLATPKAFKLWGNLGVGYSHDGRIPGCLEVGLKFKDRISISGQAIYTDRFCAIGWIKVWF